MENAGTPIRKRKPNNAMIVNAGIDSGFFRKWCIFLRPFVELTTREMDVLSSFLKQRWELSKKIKDRSILDTMLMSEETKKKVIKDCHITLQHFYVIMSNLRKHKVISDNRIDPRLIPNVREDDNGIFMLTILFKDNKPKDGVQ